MGVIGLLLTVGCTSATPLRQAESQGDYVVTVVSRWDDCLLYRIERSMVNSIFVARCGSEVNTTWFRHQSNGKTSRTVREEVQTVP